MTDNDKLLTYPVLRATLDAARWADENHVRSDALIQPASGEGAPVELIPGELAIHDHPRGDRPLEIHVMCMTPGVGWQKIAEIGPPLGTGPGEVDGHGVAPGYVDVLAQWQGQPVGHVGWKNRIMADNDLTPHDRASIDAMARNVKDLAVKAINAGPYAVGTAAETAEAAIQLADAVLAAHEVHASYADALAAFDSRDRT